MKKIMILATLALLSQSCITYTDKDEDENPQLQSAIFIHSHILRDVAAAIELADFFDRYQAVREDRDAATSLGMEYFGDRFILNNLVYERYDGYRGSILVTDVSGEYVMDMNSFPINDSGLRLHAEALGDRQYHITTEHPDTRGVPPHYQAVGLEMDITASVAQNGTATIGNLNIIYRELSAGKSTTVNVTSTPDPAQFRLCTSLQPTYLPYSGILDYKIGGDMINDEFSVKYNEETFDIL